VRAGAARLRGPLPRASRGLGLPKARASCICQRIQASSTILRCTDMNTPVVEGNGAQAGTAGYAPRENIGHRLTQAGRAGYGPRENIGHSGLATGPVRPSARPSRVPGRN
jgi:hypothetical protein